MINSNKEKDVQLYVVATPIGNRADISFRAVEILKSVDLIACEDCRTSSPLLESYGISTKLVSYHKFNEKQRTSEFLNVIKEGKKIALISDAGTPCISDPGRILVQELLDCGVKVSAVPGACAVSTFLSMIPREREEFSFVGFLPRVKSQQQKLFEKYKNFDTVFYESANRLAETLENIAEFRGKDAGITVGRELTKRYEEICFGSVEEIIEYFKNNTLKGEIVCILYATIANNDNDSNIVEQIKKLKNLNYSDKDISAILSALFDVNKNKIYKLSLNMKQ